MNDFTKNANTYHKTNEKPDKKFSILPTVIKLLSPIEDRVVVDLGCGSGFFSYPIAESKAMAVYGIDNCPEMLKLAPCRVNIEYLHRDIFLGEIPRCDIINAPFVLNYSSSIRQLDELTKKCSSSIDKGKMVSVVDLPSSGDNKAEEYNRKLGAVKRIKGNRVDEADMEIELFVGGEKIITLNAKYYSMKTLETSMYKAGFSKVSWHKPKVSLEGIRAFGKGFWKDYTRRCELGYLVAKK